MSSADRDSEWKSISDSANKGLKNDELARAQNYGEKDQVVEYVQHLQDRYGSVRFEQHVQTFDNIIENGSRLYHAVHRLCDGWSDVSAQVWRMLGLGIESMADTTERIDIAEKLYTEIFATLPHYSFDVLEPSFNPRSIPHFRELLLEIYREHLMSSILAVEVFQRSGDKIGIVQKMRWKRGANKRSIKVKSLNRLRDQVQNYLNAKPGASRASTFQVSPGSYAESIVLSDMSSLTLTPPAPQFPQFNIPQPLATFSGRIQPLEHLQAVFGLEDPTKGKLPQRRRKVAVVHGLGGVGKTQLSKEFAQQNRDRFDACYWIQADTPVKLSKSFDEIAKKLKIEEPIHAQSRSEVKRWLENTDRDWLLIFDNAEDFKDLEDYLPLGQFGCILITSRDKTWATEEFVNRVVELKSFSADEGLQMFNSIIERYGRPEIHASIAAKIIEEVGHLPLAIRQVASYIAMTHTNPRDFLKRYKEQEGEAARVAQYPIKNEPGALGLSTVWNLTLKKLSPAAIFLFNVMILLDPDNIPMNFFAEHVEEGELKYIEKWDDYDAAIELLQRYSLVTISTSSSGNEIWSIHRQVRRDVLNKISPSDLQDCFQWLVAKKIRRKFPQQSPFAEPLSRRWDECAEWISHLMSMNAILKSDSSKLELRDELFAEVLVDGSIYLWEKGLLADGEAMIISAKSICQKAKRSNILLSEVYSFHGCILSDRGKLEQARECFQQELHLKKDHQRNQKKKKRKITIVDDIQLANAFNNLAGIENLLEHTNEARINNELSRRIKEKYMDKGDLQYLLSLTYMNYASTSRIRGDHAELDNKHDQAHEHWNEAAEWCEKALSVPREKQYAPRLGATYHNFGNLRLRQNRIGDAKELFEEAVLVREKNLGDHYDTATSLHALAACLSQLAASASENEAPEALNDAETLLREALRILSKQSANDNNNRARVARSKFLLSSVLQRRNNDEAQSIKREALTVLEEATGKPVTGRETDKDFEIIVPYI